MFPAFRVDFQYYAARKTRRRLHGAARLERLLAIHGYPPPPNFTVTWFEQFPVPATHTL